jgi:hypothetical protein
MAAETIHLILPASAVGGAVTLLAREIGGYFWKSRNENGKLTKEEHAVICAAQYARIESSINRVHERLDDLMKIMIDKK